MTHWRRNKKKLEAVCLELRSRGQYHLRQHRLLREAWAEYSRNLPPRLRNKMAPIY